MTTTSYPPDSAPVTVTLTGIEAVTGMGKVTHLAIVDIEVGGIAWQLQGVRVVKHNGGLQCQAPQFRHPKSGRYLPGVVLPGVLSDHIAAEVLAAVS